MNKTGCTKEKKQPLVMKFVRLMFLLKVYGALRKVEVHISQFM